MIQKLKLTFDEHNVLQSSVSVFVRQFDLDPVILKADIDDGVGIMILDIKGEESKVTDAVQYLRDHGIAVSLLNDKHITRDHAKCFSCGACTSICITKALVMDPDTFEVHVHPEKCVACAKCISSCPVHALKINL